ncbi:MAG: FadR family transcriptional regulator [Rhodobacteraceae bacterium]|nr:FadR family transcriptional regulator [Paracoccaceae bacterium]
MGQKVHIPRYRLAADQIVAMISAGQLRPGDRMPTDRELVEQLSVSRATVREAMIALEVRGYVETRFGYGARVATVLPVEHGGEAAPLAAPGFFELVEARLHVEGLIARLAAARINDAQLDHLEELAEAPARRGLTPYEITELDRSFHLCLAKTAQNSVLTQVVEEFWRLRSQFPQWAKAHNLIQPNGIAIYLRDEHVGIVNALRARNPAAAEAKMQQHCRNFGQTLLENWHRYEGQTGEEPER